jgi:hypothetical protein
VRVKMRIDLLSYPKRYLIRGKTIMEIIAGLWHDLRKTNYKSDTCT